MATVIQDYADIREIRVCDEQIFDWRVGNFRSSACSETIGELRNTKGLI